MSELIVVSQLLGSYSYHHMLGTFNSTNKSPGKQYRFGEVPCLRERLKAPLFLVLGAGETNLMWNLKLTMI